MGFISCAIEEYAGEAVPLECSRATYYINSELGVVQRHAEGLWRTLHCIAASVLRVNVASAGMTPGLAKSSCFRCETPVSAIFWRTSDRGSVECAG